MRTIVSSTWVAGATQVDGTVSIRESHLLSDQSIVSFDYFAAESVDPNTVMTLRAQRLQADLEAQAVNETESQNGTIHLTKLQFRRLFTFPERMAIDQFNATFESNPMLSDEQKALVRTSLNDYDVAEGVYLNDPATVAGVQLYETLGLIAAGRAAEILNG